MSAVLVDDEPDARFICVVYGIEELFVDVDPLSEIVVRSIS